MKRPKPSFCNSISALLLLIVVFLHQFPFAGGLKCIQCSNVGGFAPCQQLVTRPTECKPPDDQSCFKGTLTMSGAEREMRSCSSQPASDSEQCTNQGAGKLCGYLCDTDGCNSGDLSEPPDEDDDDDSERSAPSGNGSSPSSSDPSPSSRSPTSSSADPLLVWVMAVGASLFLLFFSGN